MEKEQREDKMKIIDIIKNFFNKLKSNKTKMIEEKNENSINGVAISNEEKRELFAKSINESERIELSDLQKKLESKQISVNELNIFEVMDLIDMYKNNINELNKRIETY